MDPAAMFQAAIARLNADKARLLDNQEQKTLGNAPQPDPTAPPPAATAPPDTGQGAFLRGFTPADRLRQQQQLADMLRARQSPPTQ